MVYGPFRYFARKAIARVRPHRYLGIGPIWYWSATVAIVPNEYGQGVLDPATGGFRSPSITDAELANGGPNYFLDIMREVDVTVVGEEICDGFRVIDLEMQ